MIELQDFTAEKANVRGAVEDYLVSAFDMYPPTEVCEAARYALWEGGIAGVPLWPLPQAASFVTMPWMSHCRARAAWSWRMPPPWCSTIFHRWTMPK